MKNKNELIRELRSFTRTRCCVEAADRLANDETHIRALQKEIRDLRSEIERLHEENFWLTNRKDGAE